MLVVREIGESDAGTWDEMVNRSQEGTPFHCSAWIRSVDASLGLSTKRLGAFERRAPVGLLPVCVNVAPREWLSTRKDPLTASSPPVRFEHPYGGPIALPGRRDAIIALVQHVLRRHLSAEIAFAPDPLDPRREYPELEGHGAQVSVLPTYLIDLKRSEDALWSSCRGNMRTNVRNARRKGVRFTVHGADSGFEDFYRLIQRTYARSGFSPFGESFYRRILEAFGDSAWCFFAEVDGERVASEVSIVHGRRLFAWSGGSDERYWKFRPNNLLSWEIVRWALERGLELYDLCGAGLPSIGKFKESLGGRLHSYPLLQSSRIPRPLSSCLSALLRKSRVVPAHPSAGRS